MEKMANKKVLVTGAGTGIGREIALEFARQGADVVLHYSRSAEGAESAAEEIRAGGRRAAALHADFRNGESAVELGGRALDFLGRIDCLINNAGITFNRPFLKIKVEQVDTVLNVNLRSPYLLTQNVAEQMVRQGSGAICNLTSIHGVQGAPEHSIYAATKGAIIAWTRALGVELAHKGVRVNAIAPGWITVENYSNALPGFDAAQAAEEAKRTVPVARYGIPLDVAKLAVYLCSDDAGFIVGQTIVIDGGSTSLMSLISDFRNESAARFGKGYVPGV
jgi:NAD(P)-dependent dehydrogenase (short-subunit alcohol dehydrogenase family)